MDDFRLDCPGCYCPDGVIDDLTLICVVDDTSGDFLDDG